MIAGMAAVTIATRATIFVLGDRIVFPPLLRQALDFVPVTVLSAIVVPMVVAPHGAGLEITWQQSATGGSHRRRRSCARSTRHQLLTIVGCDAGVLRLAVRRPELGSRQS